MLIRINTQTFYMLQGDTSETDFSKKLGISRTHLWRLKREMAVGQDFIGKFKKIYPDKKFEDYFTVA